ncbi:protein TAPT1 homolog [Sitophilus oryzae]|uniref:Protein TAPT1 homolog n=1 Tax=Sitophilus oryzae TaxID=7048 RepID=A0A6J2XZB1_SITOR|nr:protein TAPT1 homolog [Sitophilus oryzae]
MEEKSVSGIEKKIRFRQPTKILFKQDSKIEDLIGNEYKEKGDMDYTRSAKSPSLLSFLQVEVTRDYLLENDEERFSARREKIYSFMRIPKEVEKFMQYGIMHCTDSFLFLYTFLPVRVVLALWALVTRPFSKCFGLNNPNRKILTPAEICDLLKAIILVFCTTVLWCLDTNMMYHMIKSQSVIKLYLFYNMLEIGDRLFSSLGQDTIDALFWTATEPRGKKREHLGVIPHLVFVLVYVILHSILVLFQATTLNVAVNSNNKALLTIMMSNNFVELKGSVFKKFDKNNLFQVSCSDVRERFHLVILLFIVILQTLREYSWKIDNVWVLLVDCFAVLFAEVLVDWIKHAFITRFNELHLDVYKDYRTSLAYDLAQSRQKHAFSDHSDLVARRMGFIPLPLGVIMFRVLFTSINIKNIPAVIILLVAYLCLWSTKILNSIFILGKACAFISQHKMEKNLQSSPLNNTDVKEKLKDIATSPQHPVYEQPRRGSYLKSSFPSIDVKNDDLIVNSPPSDLGASAIFANSTVDLKNASLNEELLKVNGEDIRIEQTSEEILTRSVPDFKKELSENELMSKTEMENLKKSESEPNLINMADSQCKDT